MVFTEHMASSVFTEHMASSVIAAANLPIADTAHLPFGCDESWIARAGSKPVIQQRKLAPRIGMPARPGVVSGPPVETEDCRNDIA